MARLDGEDVKLCIGLNSPSPEFEMDIASSQAVEILIVEDNRIDARLIVHALDKVKEWALRTNIVDDGEKAIQYLLRVDGYLDAAHPDLIILDLNLPKRDGTEVLRVIRESAGHKELPVFILSSSPIDVIEEQVRNAKLAADACFTKPYEVGNFLDIAREIHSRYLAIQSAKVTRSRSAAQ
jgi:two-component system, chemotaxis family, response regulator Rcp1